MRTGSPSCALTPQAISAVGDVAGSAGTIPSVKEALGPGDASKVLKDLYEEAKRAYEERNPGGKKGDKNSPSISIDVKAENGSLIHVHGDTLKETDKSGKKYLWIKMKGGEVPDPKKK